MTNLENSEADIFYLDPEPQLVVLVVPNSETSSSMDDLWVNVKATNPASSSQRFFLNGVIPELFDGTHQILPSERQEPKPSDFNYSWVQPESFGGALQRLQLFWQNGELTLAAGYAFLTKFTGLQAGEYLLRFRHCPPPSRSRRWASTPSVSSFINLRLVEPVAANPSAVDVNGIQFETIAPAQVTVRSGQSTPVRLGIRISNFSTTQQRFFFYEIRPSLYNAYGQSIYRDGGRNATRLPTKDNFHLLMPGERVEFFVDGKFSCSGNRLGFGGYDNSGGFWHFRNLTIDQYQVGFTYNVHKLSESWLSRARHQEIRELAPDIWTGIVTIPCQPFQIVLAEDES